MSSQAEESLIQENQRLRDELAEAQRQLLLAQKMGAVGELAASISHEFNNILTTVINYAKLGLRHQDNASREKAFNKILAAGQRAAKITTGMLSYVRNKSDRKEASSITKLMQDVVVLVEKDLQVHRISHELRVQGDPYALINTGEIQQVAMNLIVNARQAMDPGGAITLAVTENLVQGTCEILIQDSGRGIPSDVLPHIFDKFFTTKSTDANGQGGTGLGLALCKEIIEAHGGRIRVETAVGHGTKFTLILPRVEKPSLMSTVSRAS